MVVCVNRPRVRSETAPSMGQQAWLELALQTHFWLQSACISAAQQAVLGILDAAPAKEVPTGEPHSIMEQRFAPAKLNMTLNLPLEFSAILGSGKLYGMIECLVPAVEPNTWCTAVLPKDPEL